MFTVMNCAQISIEFIEMVSGRSYYALSWLDTKLERKELMDDKEGEECGRSIKRGEELA
jgi:hypothetical protein